MLYFTAGQEFKRSDAARQNLPQVLYERPEGRQKHSKQNRQHRLQHQRQLPKHTLSPVHDSIRRSAPTSPWSEQSHHRQRRPVLDRHRLPDFGRKSLAVEPCPRMLHLGYYRQIFPSVGTSNAECRAAPPAELIGAEASRVAGKEGHGRQRMHRRCTVGLR